MCKNDKIKKIIRSNDRLVQRDHLSVVSQIYEALPVHEGAGDVLDSAGPREHVDLNVHQLSSQAYTASRTKIFVA